MGNIKIIKSIIMVLVVSAGTGLLSGKPEVFISSAVVYPRASMLESEEGTLWYSTISYKQNISKNFKLTSQFEVGSETGSLPNPFRVYSLTASYSAGDNSLRLGRISHWSTLALARVDGAEYKRKTGIGTFKVFGGFNAVTDFSDTSFTDNTFILAGWNAGKAGKNIGLAYWIDKNADESVSYFGINGSRKLFAGFRFKATLAWSLTDNQLYHSRVRLTRLFGSHRLALGLRQKSYFNGNPYPWVTEKLNTAPVVSLGLNSRLGSKMLWWNQLNYRLAEEPVQYLRSTLAIGDYSVTAVAGLRGDKKFLGTSAGLKKALTKSINLGGSLSYNTLSYEDLIEPENSLGLYGWIGWEPSPTVSLKLFSRYYQNSYFKVDGRGGMIVNVAF